MKKNRMIIVLLSICMVLSGCHAGIPAGDFGVGTSEYKSPLQAAEAEAGYEVPVLKPGILADRMGYEPAGNKTVIFRESGQEDTFTLRDAESREIVYTGTIRTRSSVGNQEEYSSYGDFSEFKEPGEYYIQMDTFGESYPFIIHDNLYYSLFKRSCEKLYGMRSADGDEESGWQMEEKGQNREMAACLCIYQLLAAYELFPEVYSDDMGIPESGNEIADILDECRYEVKWLMRQAQVNPDGDGAVCGYRAAVLAKYAWLIKNQDSAFAAECLKAAQSAWKSMEKDTSAPKDVAALAASELYRASGQSQYMSVAEQQLQGCLEKSRLSDAEFFCGVTYMNTSGRVDMELCNMIIGKIMEGAEAIAEKTKSSSFFICSEKSNAGAEELLREMQRICVVNHIITNHEYNTVIENHFHYLMGRNPGGVRYVSCWEGQEIEAEDIMENPVLNAAFIFMLSQLLSNQAL